MASSNFDILDFKVEVGWYSRLLEEMYFHEASENSNKHLWSSSTVLEASPKFHFV